MPEPGRGERARLRRRLPRRGRGWGEGGGAAGGPEAPGAWQGSEGPPGVKRERRKMASARPRRPSLPPAGGCLAMIAARIRCCRPAGLPPSLPPGHPLWPRARRERGGGGRAAPPGPHLPAGRGGPSCLVPAAEANEMGIKRKIYIYTCFWFYTSILEKVDLGNQI